MGLSSDLAPGLYVGTGDGDESGAFVARIEISRLPNGGVLIGYEATSRAHGVQHREQTMLVAGADGRDRLYIAHSESPFVTEMIETRSGSGRFEQAAKSGPYEMAVVIDRPSEDELTYAWWWGASGDPPAEQSKADTRRQV